MLMVSSQATVGQMLSVFVTISLLLATKWYKPYLFVNVFSVGLQRCIFSEEELAIIS